MTELASGKRASGFYALWMKVLRVLAVCLPDLDGEISEEDHGTVNGFWSELRHFEYGIPPRRPGDGNDSSFRICRTMDLEGEQRQRNE